MWLGIHISFKFLQLCPGRLSNEAGRMSQVMSQLHFKNKLKYQVDFLHVFRHPQMQLLDLVQACSYTRRNDEDNAQYSINIMVRINRVMMMIFFAYGTSIEVTNSFTHFHLGIYRIIYYILNFNISLWNQPVGLVVVFFVFPLRYRWLKKR